MRRSPYEVQPTQPTIPPALNATARRGGGARRALQLGLAVVAIIALIVVGVTLAQIAFAPTLHGGPARIVPLVAGPYHVNLTLYADPANAGYALPFALAPAAGTPGPLTYQMTATPGPGVKASVTQATFTGSSSAGTAGSVYITVRGQWTLQITVNGPAGAATVATPITATAPPTIPTWFAWLIGLIPLYGALAFFLLLRRRSAPATAQAS